MRRKRIFAHQNNVIVKQCLFEGSELQERNCFDVLFVNKRTKTGIEKERNRESDRAKQFCEFKMSKDLDYIVEIDQNSSA